MLSSAQVSLLSTADLAGLTSTNLRAITTSAIAGVTTTNLAQLTTTALSNTRTTLTIWPVRLLMWNLPYHAEHHLYPSIPFHALPTAHAQVRDQLGFVADGYLSVHRALLPGMMGR